MLLIFLNLIPKGCSVRPNGYWPSAEPSGVAQRIRLRINSSEQLSSSQQNGELRRSMRKCTLLELNNVLTGTERPVCPLW